MPDEGASLSSEFSEAELLSDIQRVVAGLDPAPTAVHDAARAAFAQQGKKVEETLRLQRDEFDAVASHRRLVFDGELFAAVIYARAVTEAASELVCVVQSVHAQHADEVEHIVPTLEYEQRSLTASSTSGKVHQWNGLVAGPVRISFLDPDDPSLRSATEWFIL